MSRRKRQRSFFAVAKHAMRHLRDETRAFDELVAFAEEVGFTIVVSRKPPPTRQQVATPPMADAALLTRRRVWIRNRRDISVAWAFHELFHGLEFDAKILAEEGLLGRLVAEHLLAQRAGPNVFRAWELLSRLFLVPYRRATPAMVQKQLQSFREVGDITRRLDGLVWNLESTWTAGRWPWGLHPRKTRDRFVRMFAKHAVSTSWHIRPQELSPDLLPDPIIAIPHPPRRTTQRALARLLRSTMKIQDDVMSVMPFDPPNKDAFREASARLDQHEAKMRADLDRLKPIGLLQRVLASECVSALGFMRDELNYRLNRKLLNATFPPTETTKDN